MRGEKNVSKETLRSLTHRIHGEMPSFHQMQLNRTTSQKGNDSKIVF